MKSPGTKKIVSKVPLTPAQLRARPPVFRAKSVETVYEIDGEALWVALNAIGLPQNEFAELCGYSGSSRICHIIRNGRHRIGGEALKTITTALAKRGVRVVVQNTAASRIE